MENTEIRTGVLDRLLIDSGLSAESESLLREIFDVLLECASGDVAGCLVKTPVEKIGKFNRIVGDLLESCFLRSLEDPSQVDYRQAMRFGLIDERMISPEDAEVIRGIYQNDREYSNIVDLRSWLQLIYEKQVRPSVSDLGEDYYIYLEKKSRSSPGLKREELYRAEDPKNDVKYEMNVLRSIMRTMTLGFKNGIYALNSYQSGKIERTRVMCVDIAAQVAELKNIDYSAFYREILYMPVENQFEVVRKEVEPYLVCLPVCGDRVIFWQELDGTNKRTRGRIFFPAFFTGKDLRTAFWEAIGNFKWELGRTIQGRMWMDPTEGGYNGAFYDYITFFKRDKRLSEANRKVIEEIISRYRKDLRKIYGYYYLTWLVKESQGIVKLDKAIRDIFWKYHPFYKKIRESLVNFPVHAQLIERFDRIRMQVLQRIRVSYKKYASSETGELPEDLAENLRFYEEN